jgi:hypothetical protein
VGKRRHQRQRDDVTHDAFNALRKSPSRLRQVPLDDRHFFGSRAGFVLPDEPELLEICPA